MMSRGIDCCISILPVYGHLLLSCLSFQDIVLEYLNQHMDWRAVFDNIIFLSSLFPPLFLGENCSKIIFEPIFRTEEDWEPTIYSLLTLFLGRITGCFWFGRHAKSRVFISWLWIRQFRFRTIESVFTSFYLLLLFKETSSL